MLTTLLFLLATQPSSPVLGIERYEIDARTSTIGFDGTSTLHDFTGKTHAILGDIRVDRDEPARIAGGAVWIETRTLDTDNESRDADMREALDVQHFPQIMFQLDQVQGKLVNGKGEFTAQGRFTIKGVEKKREVKFHVEPVPPSKDNSGHDIRVLGEVKVKLSDHGIKVPSVLFVKMHDDVRVWLDLTLRPVTDAGVEAKVRTLRVDDEFVPKSNPAARMKRTATEIVWTAGSKRLWERELQPGWVLAGERGLVTVDPRTGRTQPADEVAQQSWDALAKVAGVGTSATVTIEEPDGRHTLVLTFVDEVDGRLPAWALDPDSWSNGPAAAR